MMNADHRQPAPVRPRRSRSFTLAELLVVMGIIGILAAVTVVAVGAIGRDARLATAKNQVVSMLEAARTAAIARNEPVLVVFRARFDGSNRTEQFIEGLTATWSGDRYLVNPFGNTLVVVDRFVPIPDTESRRLPRGIKIAAPLYGANVVGDEVWVTSTDLPAVRARGEMAGVIVGVMFGPDGTRITGNLGSLSDLLFVDFENEDPRFVLQRQGENDFDNVTGYPDNQGYCDLGDFPQTVDFPQFFQMYFCQADPEDEPYITLAPFLAVFDDEEAREISDVSRWSDGRARTEHLSAYVNDRADRIHFNRYTGVVMR